MNDTIEQLLGDIADTHEIVLRRPEGGDVLQAAWRIAAADARDAYAAWCEHPTVLTYATYLALVDQADMAAEALAADHCSRVPADCGCPHAPQPLAA